MYYTIKATAKLVGKSPHIIERIVKAYSLPPKKITKKTKTFNSYNLEDVKRYIDYEASIKPLPNGMAFISTIRNKYSLNSINWKSVYTLPDAPQPKGKCFDPGMRIRSYYSEKEWDEYLCMLKASGHPLLIARTRIPGPEIKRNKEKELKVNIHPDRQAAFNQAAKSKLLNNAFLMIK